MTPFDFLKGERAHRIEAIEAMLESMLDSDRREVDLAMAVLLGDLAAKEANLELRASDRKVNETQREVRRQLMVHASVFGSVEIPSVLVYMSIVKDIERVGDYAKNLIDLALDGVTLEDAPDLDEWRRLSEDIASFMLEATRVFRERDVDGAHRLLVRGDELLTYCDDGVSALVKGEDQDPEPVARALALRYIKRVVAHLLNVLTAVVMPLDRLDYLDESPEDRE